MALPQLKTTVYGDPGVGKTTFLLTFPKVFIIDTDNGLEGDAVAGWQLVDYREVDTRNMPDLDSVIIYAKPKGYRDVEDALRWFIHNMQHFRTFGIDSIDGLSRLLLNEVVDEGKGKAKNLQQLFVPEQAEYGVNLRQMERILDSLASLPCHIVLTSAVREKEGSKRQVDLTPSISAVVRRWTNLYGEMLVVRRDPQGNIVAQGGEVERVFYLDPSTPKRECKTRWAALLPYVQNPTYTTIKEKIQ